MGIKAQARLAGLLYLIVILGGGYAEIFVRQALTVPGDAAATAHNILAHTGLWRIGYGADLANLVAGVGMTPIFWNLFRPINQNIILLALLFGTLSDAIVSTALLGHLAPLTILHDAPGSQVLALLVLDLHEQVFGISLVFFGVFCVLTGYLIYRSRFLPRALGALYGLAGVCYILNSLALALAPGLQKLVFPGILLPSLVGEASVCLWLLVMGVDAARWRDAASGRMAGIARA